MRVLSLFSGIGGFDLGLERAGMEVVGQVEIDPYCRKVLAKHWPGVARYEDVRSVGAHGAWPGVGRGVGDAARTGLQPVGRESLWGRTPVDLICGGFPCQDLSVAGKRAGLDGERSGLWFEFRRIVSELRPKYVLVENVPGLLSSNRGRDFEIILRGLGELGYGVSWAVLDSQHFGVAQRRRRVFIVAGPPDGRTEAILSIAEGCGGHPQAGGTAGEDAAAAVDGRIADTLSVGANQYSGFAREPVEVANPLGSNQTGGFRFDLDGDTYIPDIAHPVNARDSKGVNQREDAMGFTSSGAGWWNEGLPNLRTQSGGTDREMVGSSAAVRRLTPVECARLQGFPDDWLDGADGPQYRALGNAVTVPVIEWIGRRMMAVEAIAVGAICPAPL